MNQLTHPIKTGAIVLLLAALQLPALWAEQSAQNAQVRARAAAVVTDQAQYLPGSTATILGSGFTPGETVVIEVLRADDDQGVVTPHQPWATTANDRGDFVSEWPVCESDCVGSQLQLVATGQTSGRVGTASITDGRQGIKALASNKGNSSSNPQLQAWFNTSQQWGGTVQGSNSRYTEGNGIPLRFTAGLTPGSTHTVLLKFDFSTGGTARFFDSLVSYNASVTNATPTTGISNPGNSKTWPIPADGSLPTGAQPQGVFTTYNISSLSAGNYTLVNGVKVLPVTFTVGSGQSSANVVIAYGGHLASAKTWGPNNGSSQFPGASTKAYASFDGGSDMNVSVNPGAVVAAADLAIAKIASPQPVFSGDNLVYQLFITNVGPDAASSVVVTDALPAGLSFVSATLSQGNVSGANPLSFNLGSLNADVIASITIVTKVTVNTDTTISNAAWVASTTLDPVTTNNIASALSTVVDRNPPIIKCPGDIVKPTDPGQCGAVVDFSATATDDEPNLLITYSVTPGSFFPKGTTTVVCTATDPVGNSASCSFKVTVQDQELPKITCPKDITVNAAEGSCSAIVSFEVAVSDNCPGAAVVCTPPSGSSFATGTTPVSCVATDAAGNTSTCTFNVTVKDNQPPQLVCPGNIITQAAADRCDATVTFTALSALDNCDGPVPVICTPPSGSTFPIGTNLVVCTATDSAGNTTNCSFLVVVQDPPNQSWPQALALDLGSAPGLQQASIQQCLTALDQSRWYKFKVQPGSRLVVTLTGLPENYDLVLFKDIGAAYNQLTTLDDLAHLSAEFAADAFSPSAFSSDAFSPSAFSPSAFSPSAFSPSAFSPSAFSPSAFSPSAFSPSAFSPDAYAPSAFSPSAFSPSAFSPSAFSPSAFSPSAFSPSAFSAAQIQSVVAVSAFDGTAGEGVLADTWDNDGNFYVRVRGRNGVFSPGNPFSLNIYQQTGACGNVVPVPIVNGNPLPPSTTAAPGGGYQTLILTDLNRWLGSSQSPEKTSVSQKLAALAARPEVNGVVVDVGADSWVSFFNAQADANFDCPYAKNLVARAIQDIVNRSRNGNALQYVVLVGDDGLIPFFRYPDEALLGPERNYVPPVKDLTASQASLQLNYVLGQDAYGAQCSLSLKTSELPLPDLAVGRLVQTPAEVAGMIDAYLATSDGVVPQPASSLVTGYDFLADDANAVADELNKGIGITPDKLICPNTSAPSQCWSADDLRQALFSKRHDLIFLAGHFSASETLAADYMTHLFALELAASPIDFRNTILFSAGCHSGYNVVGPDAIPQVTLEPDWSRACAQKQATLIAGTGYQYGDTDFIEYSERLYLEFAQQLRSGSGPVSVGRALLNAKHTYLATTPEIRGIHAKSYLEATLFGLPMLRVDMPGQRRAADSLANAVSSVQLVSTDPGKTFNLGYSDLAVSQNLVPTEVPLVDTIDGTQTIATYLAGGDGIINNPAEPILPLEVRNVTVPANVLRGVGFRGGQYSDLAGKVPLTGAPTTTIRGVHATFLSEVFYPMRPWNVNYFGGLCGGIDGTTRLMAIPAQFKSDSATAETGTIRVFSEMDFRLFYDANLQSFVDADNNVSIPALAAPPSISGVLGVTTGGQVELSAHVVGNPSAGIQAVWVTYTAESGDYYGKWQSVDLTQDPVDSTLWTGTLPLNGIPAQEIRYMVQAVNGVGEVALDTKYGAYHVPDEFDSGSTANLTPTKVKLQAGPNNGIYGSTQTFSALLTLNDGTPLAGQRIVFSLSGQQLWAITDANGIAKAGLPLRSMPATYQISAFFRGAPGLAPSFDTGAFTITRLHTALSISPNQIYSKDNVDTRIVAKLTDEAGNPILERTVMFTVSGPHGAYGVPVTTDINGNAPLGKVNLPDGTYTVSAYFNGSIPLPGQTITVDDGIYVPASASGPKLIVDNLPPVITCPANIIQATTVGRCDALVTYTTTATDENPDVQLVCSPPSGSVFPKGTNQVTCVATDLAGNTSTCSFLVIVVDSELPILTCPGNIAVSTDSGKPTATVNFTLKATDNCPGVLVGSSPASGSAFPIGTTTVNCVATDSSGNQSTCSFTVTVTDTQPPVIQSVTASPSILWPPDHEMILVTITVQGSDNSGAITSKIISVSSSDPTNTTGDGNTGGDWYIPPPSTFVTGPLTLYLRAERASAGVGRVYTITVQSKDSSGNVINSQVTATVPPNQ